MPSSPSAASNRLTDALCAVRRSVTFLVFMHFARHNILPAFSDAAAFIHGAIDRECHQRPETLAREPTAEMETETAMEMKMAMATVENSIVSSTILLPPLSKTTHTCAVPTMDRTASTSGSPDHLSTCSCFAFANPLQQTLAFLNASFQAFCCGVASQSVLMQRF